MKIDEDGRFPHPVLSRDTGDYSEGDFGIEITVEELPYPAQVSVDYKVTLTEPTLRAAIADNRAAVGLFVTCRDTYFSRLIPLGLVDARFSFEPGTLIGRVTLRPMVWARKALAAFPIPNCHAEFGAVKIDLAAGSVIALDDEIAINVGREKLAQMETIFSLVEWPELTGGELSIHLEDDRIKILVASDIFQQVNSLRESAVGKPIILNSVFLPAVMEVLANLKDGANGYEGLRWHRVFTAKCEHLGIQIENADLWRDAQRLLEMPFAELSNCNQIMEE